MVVRSLVVKKIGLMVFISPRYSSTKIFAIHKLQILFFFQIVRTDRRYVKKTKFSKI